MRLLVFHSTSFRTNENDKKQSSSAAPISSSATPKTPSGSCTRTTTAARKQSTTAVEEDAAVRSLLRKTTGCRAGVPIRTATKVTRTAKEGNTADVHTITYTSTTRRAVPPARLTVLSLPLPLDAAMAHRTLPSPLPVTPPLLPLTIPSPLTLTRNNLSTQITTPPRSHRARQRLTTPSDRPARPLSHPRARSPTHSLR